MQSFAVNRDALATTPGLTEQARAGALGVLDGLELPDRTPFVIEDDGSFTGCWPLNQYILDALASNGVGLHALRYERMPVLKRFTEWLRTRPEGSPLSEEDAPGTDTRTASPLTAVRRDLVKFRAHRSNEVAASTLDKEMSYLSGFFDHAARQGWIAQSPVPRWGKRNTLLTGGRVQRRAKFMTAVQSSHFLTAGPRGEGDALGKPPAYPERDYAYGLLLASTGLRRNEGAYLLDNEIPPRHDFSPDGIHTFGRTGKKGVTRTVYVTQEVAGAVDLYRAVERDHMIETAQPRLRRLLREEQLLRLDEMTEHRGEPAVVLNGKVVFTTALDEGQRRRAVLVRDTGRVEPAACSSLSWACRRPSGTGTSSSPQRETGCISASTNTARQHTSPCRRTPCGTPSRCGCWRS